MTIEEAKQHSRSFCHEDRIDRFIDKIYDDFESRICENCIHLDGSGVCRSKKSQCWDLDITDNKALSFFRNISEDELNNFGCNKFERKQNEN